MAPSELQTKVFSGISWLSLTSGIEIVASIVRIPILARLLQPHDFGIFAIATLLMTSLNTMTKSGFGEAIIHRKHDPEPYLNDTWTFGIIRQIALGLLLILLAPYAAVFFHEPDVIGVIYLLAFSLFIKGFKNPVLFLFQRDMKFKPYALIQHSIFWAEFIVTIIAVFLLRNVYALALGSIASSIVWVVVSYYAHPYRPRPSFNIQKLRKLYTYGKWITFDRATYFITNNVNTVVLGRLLESTFLGFYTMGYNISFYAQQIIDRIARPIMFPMYSKIQDEHERVYGWVKTTFTISIVLAGFIAAGIYATADVLVPVVLGDKWNPSIPLLKILAIAFFMHIPMYSMSQPLFDGIGRPDINFKLQALKGILLIATSIYAVMTYGVIGAAYALLTSLMILVPVWLYYFWQVANRFPFFLTAPVIVGALPITAAVVAHTVIQTSVTITGLGIWVLITIFFCLIAIIFGCVGSRTIHEAMNSTISLMNRR